METLHEFIEDGFVSRAVWSTDEEYGRVLDNTVVTCVDCVVISQGKILLGQRSCEPHRGGWWVIGGRMLPGERFQRTAQRVVQREIGLFISYQSRFQFINVNVYAWKRREQPPSDHGCHMSGINVCLRTSDSERPRLSLLESGRHEVAGKDFEQLRWFDPRDVISDNLFHPAIRGLAQAVLSYC